MMRGSWGVGAGKVARLHISLQGRRDREGAVFARQYCMSRRINQQSASYDMQNWNKQHQDHKELFFFSNFMLIAIAKRVAPPRSAAAVSVGTPAAVCLSRSSSLERAGRHTTRCFPSLASCRPRCSDPSPRVLAIEPSCFATTACSTKCTHVQRHTASFDIEPHGTNKQSAV